MPRQTEDKIVLEFARKWEPYGGADAMEVFVCFGLSVGEYQARLHSTLNRSGDLEPTLYRRLLRYAASR